MPKVFDDIKNQRGYYWENTQKLLWSKGVNGVKTGVTISAGPCLSTSISKDGYDLIVVLLNCKSLDARWVETHKLANWCAARMNKIKIFQSNPLNYPTLSGIGGTNSGLYLAGPPSNMKQGYSSFGGAGRGSESLASANMREQQVRILSRIKHL